MEKNESGEFDCSTDAHNDNNKTSAKGRSGEGKAAAGPTMTKLPACSLNINQTPTFYIGGVNGVSLVEGPLTSLGWKRTTDKSDERFKLKWVELKSRINFATFREGEQLVNHLPNANLLTNKLGLLNSLKEYERVTLSTKGRLPRLRMTDFHPETYKLDEKSDRDLFLDVYKDNEIWICKPTGLNQGKGIFLIRSREAIDMILEESEQKKRHPQRNFMSRIVQRYITNPLLLEGRKFDVRAYMLVASTTPFLILYHKGYVRLCCHKYDEDNMDMGRHLTNQFVQKKDPQYEKLKETTAWSMDKFNEYINEEVRPDCPVEIEEDWVHNTFAKHIQKIMIHCFNSVKHKLQSKIGYFDLFGLDFMVDTNMKIHLIEINTNPALSCNCKALREVIPGVVEETLYVAIECFEKRKRNLPLMPLESLKKFSILYCGSRSSASPLLPSRIVPQQKEYNSADRPKSQPAARQIQPSQKESTQLYSVSASWRRATKIDLAVKSESESNSETASREKLMRSSQISTSSLARSKTNRNTMFLDLAMSETKDTGVKVVKVKESENSHTNDKYARENSNNKSTVETGNNSDNKPTEETERNSKKKSTVETGNNANNKPTEETERNSNKNSEETEVEKGDPKVNVTVSKTVDSSKSAIAQSGQSAKNGQKHAKSNEVQLKMTHAEDLVTKTTSAQSQRSKEKLERGN